MIHQEIQLIMKLRKIATALILLPFFASCNHFLLKSGEIELQESLTKIPFEYKLGLPIIQVNINGKSYDFLFDTGAINIISEELANEINIKTVSFQPTRDSQGKRSMLKTVKLDSIRLGSAYFMNTAAIVADLNKSIDISCLQIDGIIGSNLMKMAVWQIDYQNQVITIANSKEALKILDNSKIIPFETSSIGKQYINIEINGVLEEHVTFDTGSNGGIVCSKATYNKLLKTDSQLISDYGYGSNSSGLYGNGSADTLFYFKPNTLKIGELNIDNQIIQFKKKGSRTIGNEFLKNYRIILDWDNQEITMIEENDAVIDPINTFGFKVFMESNKIFVKYIFNNSSADEQGIQLNDQIIKINNIDYTDTEKNCYCEIIEKGVLSECDTISISVLRNNQEQNFTLNRKTFINL